MPGHGLAIGFREIVWNFHGMDLHIYRAAVLSTPVRIHIYIYVYVHIDTIDIHIYPCIHKC